MIIIMISASDMGSSACAEGSTLIYNHKPDSRTGTMGIPADMPR